MIDFWLTMGTLVSDDRLWPAVTAAGPDYGRIGLVRTWGDGLVDNITWGGEYLETPTKSVQAALHAFFKINYSDFQVPISAYCAGALCEMAGATYGGGRSLGDLLALHHTVLAGIISTHVASLDRGFMVVAGLVMFDRGVRAEVAMGNFPAITDLLYASLTSAQMLALQEFAIHLRDGSPDDDPERGSTWDYGCRQVLLYYDRFPRAFA
jgi:hypothetical protein